MPGRCCHPTVASLPSPSVVERRKLPSRSCTVQFVVSDLTSDGWNSSVWRPGRVWTGITPSSACPPDDRPEGDAVGLSAAVPGSTGAAGTRRDGSDAVPREGPVVVVATPRSTGSLVTGADAGMGRSSGLNPEL